MASLSTRTLTVNAAFFQEIKEVDQELWRLLAEVRRITADPSELVAQRKQFLLTMETLRDQLALHFALEEAYGYFEDPVHVAPRLCDQACALRDEHRQLYVWFCDLECRAAELLGGGSRRSSALLDLVKDVETFDARLRRHEEQENELIQQEYNDDIGVGD